MSLARFLPFRKSSADTARVFGHAVKQFDLSREGQVEYAQWLHPQETQKSITQDMVDVVRQFVQPGDLVIDIGAHTGDTTVPMALAAGATGLTLALEPNPFVFAILEANAALNRDKTNIHAHNFAATTEPGEFIFHYTDRNYCNGGFKTQQRWPLFRRRHPLVVQGRNLNYVLKTQYPEWLSRFSYLKVDAEGYDLKILQTLLSTLSERRPVIRCEVFRKLVASERLALYDFLTSLGYDVVRYLGIEQGPGDRIARNDMTVTRHFDLMAMPRALKLSRASKLNRAA